MPGFLGFLSLSRGHVIRRDDNRPTDSHQGTQRMTRTLTTAVLVLAISLALAGCASTPTDPDGVGELPWNTPASWEGQFLGVPY
jgi:hypothetical protein